MALDVGGIAAHPLAQNEPCCIADAGPLVRLQVYRLSTVAVKVGSLSGRREFQVGAVVVRETIES